MMARRLNSAWIRKVNAARLFHALRERPNSSQRQLGLVTGLDKATISTVIAQLTRDGLVERTERTSGRRAGRPEMGLRIPESAGILLGVRLEPTGIDIVAADMTGRVLDRERAPGTRDLEQALDRLRDAVLTLEERLKGVPHRGIGVCIPGLVERSGHLVFAPNLQWRDVPITSRLRALFDIPVTVENDTKAAAIAERLFGACRNVDDFIYLAAQSGVGGALFLRGQLYRGASGLAGEIGHMNIVAEGRLCGCGAHGCLEAYVSETAILARLGERDLKYGDLDHVAAAARGGDREVTALLDETGGYLALALSGLVNTLNPTHIVLGGNLAIVADFIVPATQRDLERLALKPLQRDVEISISPLGADSVAMGGVALALETFLESTP